MDNQHPMNHLSLLVWNVQGAGSRDFRPTLKELLRNYKPTILALLETRISGERANEACNNIGFDGKFRIGAQGFSGGIWMFWKAGSITVNIIISHPQYITLEVVLYGRMTGYLLLFTIAPKKLQEKNFGPS